ncbi:GNAT family N-acetyltransferase [Patiriisocius sp. Uisw_017]|jgi:diamine N-acetyltransferase|uniref:GNAT family N-acetyltransferase n=1 Tax=Patiriisocius sp. Uisw_017 TaxID=3230968 RepID=UPI0039E9B48C
MILSGTSIRLRALEPIDLEFLYALENDQSVWTVSSTMTPFSKYILSEYINNAHRDIYEVKQLRLIVERISDSKPLGCIDLFDFDPQHHRAGVGIVIFNTQDRGKGYAKESLDLICVYAQDHLQTHQLYANIGDDNPLSISLFEKAGFKKIGVKKDWNFINGQYVDEFLFQKVSIEKSK